MPRMDDTTDKSGSLAKVLLGGDGKIGKTHWAGLAAEAGFNVLYFDGDVGRPTLRQLSPAARRRIYAIDCADTLGGGIKDSKFIDTMIEFTSVVQFRWNDTHQRLASRKDDPTDTIWEIKPAKMDSSCVFILDSWTGLSESMTTKAAQACSVDLASATTVEMRPVYQSAGLKSMQILQCIRSMRCHVIVICHPDEYSHTTKPEGKKVGQIKETELVVDWTKIVPKSTSKPNSMQMGKYFTDILWAETNATGSERLINARIRSSHLSGGHWSETKSFDEYSFANLVKHLGGTVPSETPAMDSWFRVVDIGASSHVADLAGAGAGPGTAERILDGTSQTTVVTPTMKSLFGKKA